MGNHILFFVSETPIHAGVGQEIGTVDLPIQREVHSRLPVIHASGVKGSIRDAFQQKVKDKKIENLIFGPEETGETAHVGSVTFTDARLLLFPVRVLGRMFAWVTCPYVLKRFFRDAKLANLFNNVNIEFEIKDNDSAFVPETYEGDVVIGDILYKTDRNANTKIKEIASTINNLCLYDDSYMKHKLQKDFIIVSDDEFTHLTETKTEIVTRIALKEDEKIVKDGALWTEESLPEESILYSIISIERVRGKNASGETEESLLNKLKEIPSRIQIGGNETTGKGFVRLVWK